MNLMERIKKLLNIKDEKKEVLKKKLCDIDQMIKERITDVKICAQKDIVNN